MKKSILIIILSLLSIVSQAQVESGSIGTETINVVKLYKPTISDADKIAVEAKKDSVIEEKKISLDYEIFSYPVASTYSPSKAKPNPLSRAQQIKLFENYLRLGFGNYTTPLFDLYITHELDKEKYVLGGLHHLSSQGGIKDVRLENSFYDSKIDLGYGVNKKDFGWQAALGYSHELYNWYGVPTDPNVFVFSENSLNEMSPSQIYQSFDVGGDVYSNKNNFKKLKLGYNYFWDDKKTAEHRFLALPTFDFEISEQQIKTDFVLDYVGGTFDRSYMSATSIEYGSFIVGATPSVIYRKDDFNFNIGAGLFYYANTASSNPKSKLLVYPNITGSYTIVDGLLAAYAGLEGGVQQNSYNQFVAENPFVSPTLTIAPTDKVYDLFIGIRGKFTKEFSFDLKGFHSYEKNKHLFTSNFFEDGLIVSRQDYEFANSFQVVYDNVSSTGIYGELEYQIKDKISATLHGKYTAYGTKRELHAWNLPKLEAGLRLRYQFLEKWGIQTEMNYIGKRIDQGIISANPNIMYSEVVVKGFFDGNLKATYAYNKQLQGFLSFNNFTNSSYQQWNQYQVQPFQVMLGASYKFDF